MRRVLVCGGRTYKDQDTLWRVLDAMHAVHGISVVIHGDAPGADKLADLWACSRGVRVEPYPADWHKHGTAAGPIRNQLMISTGKPDVVIAAPGGRGTADMKRRARKAGITVLQVMQPETPASVPTVAISDEDAL